MSFRQVFRILGLYLCGFSLTMLVPLFCAVYYQFFADQTLFPQIETPLAFVFAMLVTLILGGLMWFIGRKPTKVFFTREIIVLVLLLWIVSAMTGSLPFLFSRTLERPYDAFFESLSSLTTSGVTLMYPKKYDAGQEVPYSVKQPDGGEFVFYGTISPIKDQMGEVKKEGLEAVSRGILLWRSFMEWLGAMGVVFLFVALFPVLGIGVKNIFQFDMSGPLSRGIAPRIKDTINRLWKIYIFLTLVLFILIYSFVSHISVFDSLCVTFTTISTGGMNIHDQGLPFYHSRYLEVIVMIFMIVGSLNFGMYYYLSKGQLYRLRNKEILVFFFILVVCILFMGLALVGTRIPEEIDTGGIYSIGQAFFVGAFHAIASLTTTGFGVSEYFFWPWSVQILMILLAFMGGMVGSTTGGLKISRHYLLFKASVHRLVLFFKPDSVKMLRIDKAAVSPSTVQDVLALFWFVVLCVIISILIFIAAGLSPLNALGVVTSVVTNSGLGIRVEGTIGGLVFLSPSLKMYCAFLMLLGRLEYLLVLILFVPSFWKKG